MEVIGLKKQLKNLQDEVSDLSRLIVRISQALSEITEHDYLGDVYYVQSDGEEKTETQEVKEVNCRALVPASKVDLLKKSFTVGGKRVSRAHRKKKR